MAWQAHSAHVPVRGIIRLKQCQPLIRERIMSSFETWRRLTAVNACANVLDFTGGWEALTARAPAPRCALVQQPGPQSSTGPRPRSPWWPSCPCPTTELGHHPQPGLGAALRKRGQQAQGGWHPRDKLAPRDVFKAFGKCSRGCRGKSAFPIPFQWPGSVFMLMAVAAGIPELLQRDCSLHFHAGKEEFY